MRANCATVEDASALASTIKVSSAWFTQSIHMEAVCNIAAVR
jgi:hypothetical protein